MPSTPFGEHLKREREMRGVSLEEIAAATRISTRFLEALENGNWDELPGGAFNRGFIRSTARFLGLNEDSMVAEYALETKEQNDSRAAAAANSAMPRDLRPLGIAIAVLVVLIAGIAYGFHRLHVARVRKREAAAAAAAEANPAPAVVDVPPSSSSAPGGTPGGPAAAPGGATDPKSNDTGAAPPGVTSAVSPAVPSGKAGAPIVTTAQPAILELTIGDGKSARVKVSVDGKKVFEGRVKSKSAKTFHAHDEFEITSNETSALSVELNGHAVQVPPETKGHPFVISRKDLSAGSAKP